MNDSVSRYDTITRVLHWVMALLVLSQFLKFGDRIGDGEHWVGQTLVPTHISLGVLLLVLVVLRLLWFLRQRDSRPAYQGPTAAMARLGHILLYVCMVLMPVTGMLAMVGGGYGVQAFGRQLVPDGGPEVGWMMALGSLHSPIAWVLLVLVIGHIAATIYHHVVLKDDTLRRMAP